MKDTKLRDKLEKNTKHFRKRMEDAKFDLGGSSLFLCVFLTLLSLLELISLAVSQACLSISFLSLSFLSLPPNNKHFRENGRREI